MDITNNQIELKTAVFGGGCFWCTEAVFKFLKGVKTVLPGYSGGKIPDPTYEQVCAGGTRHVEVIKIEYDESQITFRALLEVFFATHDSTTMNRQGNDVGEQYQSVIFYTNADQQREARLFIEQLEEESVFGKPIVTQVKPFTKFYEAEDYHKNYFARNTQNPYCQVVINPKLEKLRKNFSSMLKA